MKVRRRLRRAMLLLFVCCGSAALRAAPPAAAEVAAQVRLLGSEKWEEGQRAQKQLLTWSREYPRWMLVALAEHYRQEQQLEGLRRLEELLRELSWQVVFPSPEGFIGVETMEENLPDGSPVILCSRVIPKSPAELAGMKNGDLILSMNGVLIRDLGGEAGFIRTVKSMLPGRMLEVLVQREQNKFRLAFPLGLHPDTRAQADRFARQDETAIRAWLRELRPQSGNARQPVGHFRLDDE